MDIYIYIYIYMNVGVCIRMYSAWPYEHCRFSRIRTPASPSLTHADMDIPSAPCEVGRTVDPEPVDALHLGASYRHSRHCVLVCFTHTVGPASASASLALTFDRRCLNLTLTVSLCGAGVHTRPP